MKRIITTIAVVACITLGVSTAQAGMITTTFAAGNGFTGNMFDLTTAGNGLTITGFDVNIDGSATPVPISVYYRNGTYAGHATNSAGWILAGTVAVTSQGAGNATFVDIADFGVAANSVTGMYVTVNTNVNAAPYMNYTNGSNTYTNPDLTITTGIGLGGLFGSRGIFSPRTWNGTVYYDVAPNTVPAPAGLLLALTGLPAFGLVGWVRRQRTQSAV